MSSNHARASVTSRGTIALGSAVAELRLTASRTGVTVKGERRDDVSYELWVESNGPDEAAAREAAQKARVVEDDLGSVRAIRLQVAQGGGYSARLTLTVPQHLLVRIESAGRTTVSDVRSVDLRNLTGETTITGVAEDVKGSHRAGILNVTRARSVNLSLVASQATIAEVPAVTLNVRSGECEVVRASGTVEATVLNAEFSMRESTGAARISGENGSVRIISPAGDVSVDARRTRVDVELSAPVAASIITTDQLLQLTFAAAPAVTIDAVTVDGGDIRAADLGLTATREERETRLRSTLGGGGPRIVLRNSRQDIVIGVRK
jgi:hypothetical protein